MRPGARSAGFTLIEVMVVIAIMALLLVLIVNRAPPRGASLTLATAASDLAQTLRAGRAGAIATGAPSHFTVTGGGYGTAGAMRRLPAGVTLSVTTRDGGPITFQADGSASAATIRLGFGHLADTLTLDWLTGRVGIGPVQTVEN